MFERKYTIKDNKIVKRTGETPIPEDEPIFIFRAKDRKALGALMAYCMVLDTLEMKAEVTKVINDFRLYQEKHKDEMNEPTP